MSEDKLIESQNDSQKKASASWTALFTGVSGKVLALAAVPIILMAGLNVFGTTQIFELFNQTLETREQGDIQRGKLIEASDQIKDETVVLLNSVNVAIQTHQISLLDQDSDVVETTLAARKEASDHIELFRK